MNPCGVNLQKKNCAIAEERHTFFDSLCQHKEKTDPFETMDEGEMRR